MFEIMLLPQSLHIRYTDDDGESLSIDAADYLFMRQVLADAGYTELHDGTWILLPAN